MNSQLNEIVKTGYIILLIIPLLYFSISTCSYISATNTLGIAPASHNHAQQLEKSTGKSLKIFPKKAGGLICTIYLMTFWITPAFLIVILIAKYFYKSAKIYVGLAITLIAVNVLIILLAQQFDFVGWYISYVLD